MGQNSSKCDNLKKSIRKSSSNLSSNTQNGSSSSDDEADGKINFQQKSQKKKGSKKGKMPLFRKQSTKAKKRQDHQQYLAKENPEPVFDLSNCEIEEIPSGVYALCKVLQKEVLLLHDNWLSSIHSTSNNITDLSAIRVLDVHNNELRHLPDDIGELKCLQVLNLENNRLTKLPTTVGSLSCVQTLNLKGNKIKELPESICKMKSLRMLDIRENRITDLPQHLCQVKTLETLNLDAISMKYPNYATCLSGTEAIMKFLCSECGIEYLAPSNFLLDVLEPPKPELLSPEGSRALQQEENFMVNFFLDYMASYAQPQQPVRPPTAPPPEEVFTTRQASVVARGLNSECTICLDNTSEVIFMNCGHVCTCIQCCESVQQCPLCRADIVRRVKLMAAQV
ncbi:E3 ubiquitin-protein ligase LRSAM1-like [Mercenaria mercenaria]|uniref:E3 ubiquitin-protein ligase LRSAM1-like n=1 Tax=Mercenaria mercenaria TaxID=6596 RepID=UPI00234E3992|nr:E3 ubiquitin-protein ligase LRSAM1-like [Mercenaria mercenaria]